MDHQDYKPVKSPVCWMGGKAKYAKRIVPLFPEHHVYIEPFGGGGHVLCYKPPSQGEVYNDLDGNAVNFFRVARDHGEELREKLRWIPYSRQEFKRFRRIWKSPEWLELAEMDRAVIWYSILRQCFAANMASKSWGYTAWRGGKAGAWQPDTFLNSVEGLLLAFRDRLRHVQLENLDFEDCIKRYQSEQALIYADPHYVGTEGVFAEGGFTEDDHRRLAKTLRESPAQVIVSYEDHPLVDELYEGWRRETFNAVRHSQKTSVGQKKRVATELILLNW